MEFCKKEIKFIVNRIAPLLDIKLDEFKRNKKNIKLNFEKLIEDQRASPTQQSTNHTITHSPEIPQSKSALQVKQEGAFHGFF